MRYSYEYKRKCVEMDREGKWSDTPADVSIRTFHSTVRNWVRIEEAGGPEALRHKRSNKVWNPEAKLVLIQRVIAGNSIRSVAFKAGINQGLLYQWVQKYKIYGYNGLVNMKKGRPPKTSQMKRKKVNFNNPRPFKEDYFGICVVIISLSYGLFLHF